MLLSLCVLLRVADPDDPEIQCRSRSNGSTRFYRRDLDGQIADELTCEWTFHYRMSFSREMKTYELAAEYEKDGYCVRESVRESAELDREIHFCACFLNPSPAPFQEFARQAPVRAVAMAASLGTIFDACRGPVNPAFREALALRVRYVNESVRLRVLPELVFAWTQILGDYQGLSFGAGDLLRMQVDAVVSPANSFGFMDGGIEIVR